MPPLSLTHKNIWYKHLCMLVMYTSSQVKVSWKEKWKVFPNEVNSKEHRFWQNTCILTGKWAKREFEEQIVENVKTKNKHFFRCVRNRKLAREVAGSLDDRGIKGFFKRQEDGRKPECILCISFLTGAAVFGKVVWRIQSDRDNEKWSLMTTK